MRRRFRQWRLQRARLALADAEHYYEHWVRPFGGVRPSRRQRVEDRIAVLSERVRRLERSVE